MITPYYSICLYSPRLKGHLFLIFYLTFSNNNFCLSLEYGSMQQLMSYKNDNILLCSFTCLTIFITNKMYCYVIEI